MAYFQNLNFSRYWRRMSLSLIGLLLLSTSLLSHSLALEPSEQQDKIERTIGLMLAQFHYEKRDLDDELSNKILQLYLKQLDGQKVYFLQSDIKKINTDYKNQLDDMLKNGDLSAAYTVFNLLLTRMESQLNEAVAQLKSSDFQLQQSGDIVIDPKKAVYADSQKTLDELWQKRIVHDLISLMVAENLDEKSAREKLIKRYQTRLKRMQQSTAKDVFQIYMNAVTGAFDPHSSYFSPRASENFNIQMSLSLEGIGAVLRQDEDSIKIAEVVTGGPADLSGQLQVADEIVGVAQGDKGEFVDVVGWRLDDAVAKIRGKRGTVVRLQILGSKGVMKEVRIVRDKINLDKQSAQSKIKTIESQARTFKIGVITLPTFYSDFEGARDGNKDYKSTTRDVKARLMDIKEDIDGLVIDLRGNGGGSLQEVVNLSGLFIGRQPIVQVRDSRGKINVEYSPKEPAIYEGPMIVLVDRLSASASEIFAAAMQDHGRALIIGNTTFGKGTVQTVLPLENQMIKLDDPGQLKFTIAKFYRANGESTQHKGVEPDLVLPSLINNKMIGESVEDNALPWDTLKPVKGFVARNQVFLDVLPALKAAHQKRLQQEQDLKIFMEQVTETLSLWEKTRYSLNLTERQAEQKALEHSALDRENRLRELYKLPKLTEEQFKNNQEYEDEASKQNRPDVILEESLRIFTDWLNLLQRSDDKSDAKAA